MKYHLFKKLAALGMAASVSLSAITPAFAANDSSEEFVAEAGNPDSDTEMEAPPDEGEQTPPSNEDSSNKDEGEQAPSSNEDTTPADGVSKPHYLMRTLPTTPKLLLIK